MGVPVYQLLGGRCRDKVKLFENIGGNTPEEVRESARALVEQGFISLRMTPFAKGFEHETGTRNIATAAELVGAARERKSWLYPSCRPPCWHKLRSPGPRTKAGGDIS